MFTFDGPDRPSLATSEGPDPVSDPVEWIHVSQWSTRSEAVFENPDAVQDETTVTPNGLEVRWPDGRYRSGERITPVLTRAFGPRSISFHDPYFWQNHPSRMAGDVNEVEYHWFPATAAVDHEIQPGERKSQTLHIDLGEAGAFRYSTHAPVATMDPVYLASTRAWPLFEPAGHPHIGELTEIGLDPDLGFVAKREVIDEYGWRNFGDVFADHESLYLELSQAANVSHYNNQYDAILGFGMRYLRTGDVRWRRLMDELALHVVDIDIYRTDDDRPEYRNGLFWHTDHYVDAGNATHRTHSRAQCDGVPQSGGGGPAAEHCYTSGLLLHHCITGREDSASAVMELARWIRASHEGDESLLSKMLLIVRHELPMLKRLLVPGQRAGYARYPLTRGTGNYLVALQDAYLLSGETEWLDLCARVIHQTAHPADDISEHRLSDIERRWSYTVFLQAVCRFVDISETSRSRLSDRNYAIGVVVHYARWMSVSEEFYLARSELLEFPNDTWVAQEVRKCAIWAFAAEYDREWTCRHQARAREFLTYIARTLADSETAHFSRIQIILLQNDGYLHRLLDDVTSNDSVEIDLDDFGKVPSLGLGGLLARAWRRVQPVLKRPSAAAELRWLRGRRLIRR